jgi:hypothetical protein
VKPVPVAPQAPDSIQAGSDRTEPELEVVAAAAAAQAAPEEGAALEAVVQPGLPRSSTPPFLWPFRR